MATSIGKLSKSFFVKLLVGIIILPFVFWGMGDVFRGGNQNVVATIDSKKINTQVFLNYLNRLNLNDQQIKDLRETDLMEKILSEYIGREVMDLEIKKLGITINDNALRDIIKNDKLFFKNDKFSRTEYEKFLIKSGVSAPSFEANIVQQESRRQLLGSLAGGISVPDFFVEKKFREENQTKTIKYIDLNKFHSSKKPSKEQIKELYEKNKNIFVKESKSLQYAEVTPEVLTGNKEYNETFFKKLDVLENNILDGQAFKEVVKENNLKEILISNVNNKKEDLNNKKIENLPDELFNKIYYIKKEKNTELLNIGNKYFLAEIRSINKSNRSVEDPEVLKAIKSQINFQNKIENNTSIIKEISMGGFDKLQMEKFAIEHNLEIKEYKVSDLKQNDIFSEGLVKRIFLSEDGKVDLITNSTLEKNFLILPIKTNYKKIEKNSNKFEKYEAKARLELINKIYKIYDNYINQEYKVELNKRTIDRVKNSF